MAEVDPRIAKGLRQLAEAQEAAEAAGNPELAEQIGEDIGNIVLTQVTLKDN